MNKATNKAKAREFRVVFEPDEGGWHTYIPEVQGCLTWGRSIGAARRHIREALSTCVDVFGDEADAIAVAAVFLEEVKLPAAVQGDLQAAIKARLVAAKAANEAKASVTRAARILTGKAGLSLRDAGDLLGLSHERVKQLAG